MKRGGIWFCSLVILGAAAIGAVPSANDLIVHEWGTFLAMQGSEGATLDGMYHEEHALPGFVHARSRDQLHLPSVLLKGETPVIYFYTGRKQSVSVDVRFPRGLWTQWYPQAAFVGPQLAQTGSPPQLRSGHITWSAEVIPNPRPAPTLPAPATDALWNFARDVDAAYVRVRDESSPTVRSEYERFLFYRGLGEAPLPLRMTSAAGGTLVGSPPAAGPSETEPLRHLFVLRVENGRGAYRYLPALAPGQEVTGMIPSVADARPLPEFARNVAGDLAARLVEAGLYPKEADAMVNTWRGSYCDTAGIRVLFLLPQAWTDGFIPLRVVPQPKQVLRVMVGRLELLTPEREKLAEAAVRDLAAPDPAARERAFATLRDQGRYVEPILRRVQRTTADAQVRTLCQRLLLTDFVTELRAAVNAAVDGGRMADDPLYVRAQLSSLLREVGLNDEAKAEAVPVYRALQERPAPPMSQSKARHYLRAYARAMEGLGDDRGAAHWYGQFVRFGSQVKQCAGCHDVEGPRDMAWFRDWWAGRKFAQYTARIGQQNEAIAASEQALAKNPNDTAALLMLAYLYEAKGETENAQGAWKSLTGPAAGQGNR